MANRGRSGRGAVGESSHPTAALRSVATATNAAKGAPGRPRLDPSKEFIALMDEVFLTMETTRGEDVEAWAAKLSSDVADADD